VCQYGTAVGSSKKHARVGLVKKFIKWGQSRDWVLCQHDTQYRQGVQDREGARHKGQTDTHRATHSTIGQGIARVVMPLTEWLVCAG
jgi:hypothetical protein